MNFLGSSRNLREIRRKDRTEKKNDPNMIQTIQWTNPMTSNNDPQDETSRCPGNCGTSGGKTRTCLQKTSLHGRAAYFVPAHARLVRARLLWRSLPCRAVHAQRRRARLSLFILFINSKTSFPLAFSPCRDYADSSVGIKSRLFD